MKINIYQKICLLFSILLFAFWVFLASSGSKTGFSNYFYSFLIGLIPLFGGFVAMVKARMWGTFKSAVGKAVFFIGLGLFLWGFGEAIWSYYNFFKGIAAPYPSIADIGFAPSIFFYGLGAAYLSKATGAKYGLRNTFAKVLTGIGFLIISGISYYILVTVARNGVLYTPGSPMLKTVLDILYPFGDFIALTLSVLISGLSFKYFGGKYLINIISILLGLGVMFIGDCVFAYTTTIGTYFNGDFGDVLLMFGLFLLTFGVLGFCKSKD